MARAVLGKKSKEMSKSQDLGDKNVETVRTESVSDPGTGIANIEEITENNMRRCYELTLAKIYFMSNQDKVSQNLSCVGSVRVKGPVTSDIIQTMFNECSTDNWLLIESRTLNTTQVRSKSANVRQKLDKNSLPGC